MFDVKLLDKIKFSADLSDEDKQEIASLDDTVFKRFETMEPIVNEGDRGKSFFIILSGEVAVYKSPSPNPIATLFPGAVFGEVSFLSPKFRTATVIAVEETIVLEFSRDILNNLSLPLRDRLKDKLIFLLVKHLDEVIALRTQQLYASRKVNPFDEKRKADTIRQKVMIFSDKGYHIFYIGDMKALLENEAEGTSKTVRMVELVEEIPEKFARYIKESRQSPKDYLYGESGKTGGYIVPRSARQVWDSAMNHYRTEQLMLEQDARLQQKLDSIY